MRKERIWVCRVRVCVHVCEWAKPPTKLTNLLSMCIHSMLLLTATAAFTSKIHSTIGACERVCVCVRACEYFDGTISLTTFTAYTATTASSSSSFSFSSFSLIIMIFFAYPCLFLHEPNEPTCKCIASTESIPAFNSIRMTYTRIHKHTQLSVCITTIVHAHSKSKSKRHIEIARAHISPLIPFRLCNPSDAVC